MLLFCLWKGWRDNINQEIATMSEPVVYTDVSFFNAETKRWETPADDLRIFLKFFLENSKIEQRILNEIKGRWLYPTRVTLCVVDELPKPSETDGFTERSRWRDLVHYHRIPIRLRRMLFPDTWKVRGMYYEFSKPLLDGVAYDYVVRALNEENFEARELAIYLLTLPLKNGLKLKQAVYQGGGKNLGATVFGYT
jgi:hypothetical protein